MLTEVRRSEKKMPSTVEELGPGPPTFLCDPKTPVSVTQLSDFDPTFLSLIPFRKVVITNVLTTSLVDLFPPTVIFFFKRNSARWEVTSLAHFVLEVRVVSSSSSLHEHEGRYTVHRKAYLYM